MPLHRILFRMASNRLTALSDWYWQRRVKQRLAELDEHFASRREEILVEMEKFNQEATELLERIEAEKATKH